jgi:hypothetical protein
MCSNPGAANRLGEAVRAVGNTGPNSRVQALGGGQTSVLNARAPESFRKDLPYGKALGLEGGAPLVSWSPPTVYSQC